ncbi:MAG: hypothetical protein AB1801_08315 [Chloroflexota bacterium]
MLHTITFNELSAILVDFVDSSDGFLFLRIIGAEPAVNAIWAKLSGKEGRGKKWASEVSIPIPGRSYPQYVAAQKHVTYRTLRSRLPSGMVDLVLIHPFLTVAEDTERGFYLLSYEDGVPPGFFARLNKSLAIPLKPEWELWLWELSRQPQSFLTLQTRRVWADGQQVEKTELTEITETPISRLSSLGQVACYSVRCNDRYRVAWLHFIRQQLNLGIRLKKVTGEGHSCRYFNGVWTALPANGGWELHYGDEVMARAPSVNYLLTAARETLGVHFLIKEDDNDVKAGPAQ